MTADDDVAKQISALEDRRYQAMTDGTWTRSLSCLTRPHLLGLGRQHRQQAELPGQDREQVLRLWPTGPIRNTVLVHGDCAVVLHDMRGEVLVEDDTGAEQQSARRLGEDGERRAAA